MAVFLNWSLAKRKKGVVLSFMRLAIDFDSPIVLDLRASASDPEHRLMKIAERVGMKAHSRTKPLLDLAHPFSVLMQQIESGSYNTPSGAQTLYTVVPHPTPPERNVEVVIDQYYLATGHDLKAPAVVRTDLAPAPRSLPSPRLPQRLNGRTPKVPAKLKQRETV